MKKATIFKGIEVLKALRDIDAEMPIQTASVFFRVALQPGITMKELSELENISQSSCSRNVAALSKWHRLNKLGYDLVEAREDPAERRRKVVFLTHKGTVVMKDILNILEREGVERVR